MSSCLSNGRKGWSGVVEGLGREGVYILAQETIHQHKNKYKTLDKGYEENQE